MNKKRNRRDKTQSVTPAKFQTNESLPSSTKVIPADQKKFFQKTWLAVIGLAIAGIFVYANSLSAPFIFDDTNHINNNPRIRQLWPLSLVISATNRPVVDLSLAINCALGGFNPFGYHVVNLMIHVLAAVVLMLIVRHSLSRPVVGKRYQAIAFPFALIAALLWMVHPLQTQSVTYTIQRSESLMGLFYLLVLYCVIRSVDSGAHRRWGIGAIIFCWLGMGTKEVMVTAPIMVLIYDRIFLSASWMEIKRRRGWMYLGLAAGWILLFKLAVTARENSANAGVGFAGVSSWDYALTQTQVVSHYLRLMFWPTGQCLDYDWPVNSNFVAVFPYLAVMTLLILLTAWGLRRYPAIGILGVWFFLILAPTSSVFPIGDIIFEHRMYLPSAAIIVLAVLGGESLLHKIMGTAKNRLYFTVGVTALSVGILGILTWQRNHVYRSELAMWSDVVAKAPWNDRAQLNLGNALAQSRRWPEAIDRYREALELNPGYEKIHYNLALALAHQGKEAEARQLLETAIRLKPDFAEAYRQLAGLLIRQKRNSDAMDVSRRALAINPNGAGNRYHFAMTLAELGQLDDAIGEFQAVIRQDPRHVTANFNLGNMYAQKGDFRKAIFYYTETVRLKPDFSEAQARLRDAHVVAKQLGLE